MYSRSSKEWQLSDSISQPNLRIDKGTVFCVEPYFKELKNVEYRLFVGLQAGARLNILYNIITSRKDDGKITLNRSAQCGLGGLGDVFTESQLTKFLKKCLTKLFDYKNGQLWAQRQDLVLRFDIFRVPGKTSTDNKIYLNEVELFTDANAFLVDFNGDCSQLSSLSDLTSKFITTNILAWPM